MTSVPKTTHLLVESGPDCGRLEPLSGARFTVGRSPSAGVTVDDPDLESHHLVTTSAGGFRLGNTGFRLVHDVTAAHVGERVFHRPPLPRRATPVAPVAPVMNHDERRSWVTPNPVMMITTVLSAVVVAVVSGQSSIMLMSGAGSAVMLVVWLGGRVVGAVRTHRRRAVQERSADEFHRATLDYARRLVHLRREEHPTIGELLLAARAGSPSMWSKRSIHEVALGRESCSIVPVPDGARVDVHDSPFTVSLCPGEVVGIHGARARDVMWAILVRVAVSCGPADWQAVPSRRIDSVPGFAAVRRTPIDRHDLDVDDHEGRQRIVLVDDASDLRSRSSIARRLLARPGVSMIVIADAVEELPAFCTRIVDSSDPSIDGVGPKGLAQFADALSRWIDPEAGATLSSTVGFGELHPLATASEPGSLMACIGVADDGHVAVDLVSDGPHALVVGTTGSGKSELLRTMVASLAVNHPPTAVNFVLLDYKGGAAFDGLTDLPHVVGVVTDLDQTTMSRVTRGLEAELRRRERLLRDAGCASIDAPARSGSTSLPSRLVIVVDELATLIRDEPSFVQTLMSLAQRGRSLGLHLVLGTQRAAGVVGEAVLANCNLRIALRTQSAADSSDVIGDARAVRLPRDTPGRAVVRLGHDELIHMQTAVLGTGDIDAVVNRWQNGNGWSPHRPWLDPLPEVIEPGELPYPSEEGTTAVGLMDDPDHQCRRVLAVEIRSNVLLSAPSGSSSRRMTDALTHPDRVVMHIDFTNTERLWRQLLAVEKAREPMTVVVDGLDTWRRLHAVDRFGAHLYDRFERLVHSGCCRVIIRTATRHDVPVSLASRMHHAWTCDALDGAWHVPWDGRSLEARPVRRRPATPFEVELLPAMIEAYDVARTTVARSASDLSEIDVARLVGADGRLAFCVVGPRGSGRTTALARLRDAWSVAFPDRPLTVVDEGDRRFETCPDGDVAVACTPGFLRSRNDHWMHDVRRRRSGLLLGSAAGEDTDLLGVYSVDAHPFGEMPGRGLLVVGGDVIDHVHWVSCASPFPPEPSPRFSGSTGPLAASSSSPTSSDSAHCSTTS